MEDNQEDFIVIAAGYPKEMTRFLSSNPGLPSRFEKTMYFDDYSPDDMYEIFEGMCERDRYELTDEARTAVRAHLSRIHSARNENFGNARDVRKVFKNVLSSQMRRIASLEHISDEDLSLIEATDLPAVGGAGDEDRKRAALAKLEALAGLESVKRQVTELGNLAQLNAARQKEGNRVTAPSLHTVFTGNPGTGKTTVARLIGEIYASLGILSKGHVIEVSKGDLVGEYKGHTAPKVQEAVRRAVGGVLFIDEAYSLNPSHAHSDFEREAIETLLAEMENRRADLVIIVAGYTEPMERFVESNAGLKSRFTQSVHFEDYSLDELLDIFESMSKADGYDLEPYARIAASHKIEQLHATRDETFGNAREVRTLYEQVTRNLATRLVGTENEGRGLDSKLEELSIIKAVDFPGTSDEGREEARVRKYEEALASLNALTGLVEVKEEVRTLANLARINKVRTEAGLEPESVASHLVFTGNPGTGKTTVARIVGDIFGALGLLSRGHVVDAERPDLVGDVIGATEKKTREVVKSALGGILFIDEVYSLTESDSPQDFGRIAVNTLLTEMENHRNDLMVIVAGYPREMRQFISSNPGLSRRFPTSIHFHDYSPTELFEIFEGMCIARGNRLTDEARERARWVLDWMHANRDENFGNAGEVRNVFERAIRNRANRLTEIAEPMQEDFVIFEASDILPLR